MDVGAFFRGRMGAGRTVAIVWLVTAVFLIAKFQPWAGLADVDTDDAMRMVQVRDWLAGQGWFDTTQHRGWPVPGFSMHWSRIPDLAIGGLVGLFGLIMPPARAEVSAMVVWPLLQLAAILPLIGQIARRLGGAPAVAPAMLLFGLAGPAFWQFYPGRVDHHGLQMIGLFAMLAAMLNLRRGALWGVAAGAGGALCLAVGLEALVFWLILCGAAGLILARDGARVRAGVAGFGLSVAAVTPILAFATNPTGFVASQVCDQTALPVLALAVTGGLGLAAAALISGRMTSPLARLALVAAVGLAAAAAFAVAGPDCVRGPFANVDPRLGRIWLDHVQESRGLPALLTKLDPFAVAAAGLLLIGLVAGGVLVRLRPAQMRAIALVGGLLLAAMALLVVQMRVVTYAVAFACPLISAALVLGARAARTPPRHWGAVMLAGLIVVVGTPLGARALAGMAAPKAGAGSGFQTDKRCFAPAAYAGLAALEPGLAAAPIDSGPFILLASPLSVLSAPYHRNAAGIVAADEVLSAAPDEAHAKAEALGVRYVVLCRSGAVQRFARRAPQGLAALLDVGETPEWLEPVAADAGPVRVWQVR